MTINQTNLHELCQRAATGDEHARGEFNQYVPPLVEVVVRRWLHQQRDHLPPGAEHSAASLSRRARQLTDDLCARMIAECRGRARSGTVAKDTLVLHRGGDTMHWATDCASALSGQQEP